MILCFLPRNTEDLKSHHLWKKLFHTTDEKNPKKPNHNKKDTFNILLRF